MLVGSVHKREKQTAILEIWGDLGNLGDLTGEDAKFSCDLFGFFNAFSRPACSQKQTGKQKLSWKGPHPPA